MGGAGKQVFVIAGPTAVGKTAVALDLAQHLGTDIISADSRQCYREMTIGTAKPTSEELTSVKHYFVDAFPVTEHISAADYEQLALDYLQEVFTRNDRAVVCGGTGLYIKALCEGLDEMPDIDPQIAETVNEQYQLHGLHWLQKTVQMEDPAFYKAGEIQNPARLLRALIFMRSSGASILNFRTGTHKQRDFKTIKIALNLPREQLYNRINQRVDDMMQKGLLEEVRQLYPYRHLKNLQTVGYSELFEYLEGKTGLADAVEKIKQHTRNYAKRQITWFRRDPGYVWIEADDPNIIEKILLTGHQAGAH